jgi:hypothetical protein
MKTAYCIIPADAKLESVEIPVEYVEQLKNYLESSQ